MGLASEHFVYDTTLPLNSNGTKILISLKEEKPLRLLLALVKKFRKHPPCASGVTTAAFFATNSNTSWKYALVVPQGINSTASLTISAEDPAGNGLAYAHSNDSKLIAVHPS